MKSNMAESQSRSENLTEERSTLSGDTRAFDTQAGINSFAC